MNDTVRVAVLDSTDDLEEDVAGVFLRENTLLLDVLHEFSTLRQLHDHDQLLSFQEGVIQLNDVLVTELDQTVCLLIDRVDLVGLVH